MAKSKIPHQWVEKLVLQKISFHELPQEWSEEERAKVRRQAVEKLVGKKGLAKKLVKNGVVEKARGRNCENIIGFTSVPLGIAGPIKLRGDYAKGEFYLPLATTEGALVASVSRGCKAIRESGGARVYLEDVGTTRGPVFLVSDVSQGKKISGWVERNKKKLDRLVRKTSEHIRLKGVESMGVGRNLYLRFRFDTDEAMGMNMATVATEKIVEELESLFRVKCIAVSGNVCADKKATWLNFLSGRGKKVQAEIVMPQRLVKEILKVEAEKLAEVVRRKVWLGSALSGSLGFNGHYANIVAAMFLATGQDIAHVVEGSLGITTAEMIERERFYFSVYLPDLMVGTVGGGTGLPTQQAGLSILGLGEGKKGESRVLAEVIGGAVLAGELSLLAALAQGSLGKAHVCLGRGGHG